MAAVPVPVLRLDAALPLGSMLNAATQAAHGMLLARTDASLYGPDHIWDPILAHEHSQVQEGLPTGGLRPAAQRHLRARRCG